MTKTLSLTDLEQFDPRSPTRGGERRFCCPLCGSSKPVDAAHRSLTVNTQSGAYLCHRCHSSGVLLEFRARALHGWTPPGADRRARALQRFAVPASVAQEETGEQIEGASGSLRADDAGWRRQLNLRRLAGTEGEAYLRRRGLDTALAHESGARWCEDFLGRAAVVFPFRDHFGTLTAAQGRYADGRTDPKVRTVGRISSGIFAAPPGALGARMLAIAEAPIDALSLAQSGIPALALGGVALREWLCKALAWRTVYLAFDSDEAGERAAAEWREALRFGQQVIRLRPPDGYKDWNERLQAGALRLTCVECGAWTGGYDWCDAHDPWGGMRKT